MPNIEAAEIALTQHFVNLLDQQRNGQSKSCASNEAANTKISAHDTYRGEA